MLYNTYDAIIDGWQGEEAALDFARGYVWCEVEAKPDNIGHANHIDTIDGVGVYYDYAADYYFFTDETDED
jgi:hypothetical protein